MCSTEEFCPRLVDYVVFVGTHSSYRTSCAVKNPVILNRFPPVDHADFPLPPDVALFCQPDGCYNSCGHHPHKTQHQPLFGRSTVSFVFTITDKDSSKTRFGICLNFMRPIRRRHNSRKQSCSVLEDRQRLKSQRRISVEESSIIPRCNLQDNFGAVSISESSKLSSSGRLRTHTLTSLCILTHHPFFTKFRALLEFLHKLIQKVHEHSRSKVPEDETVWSVLTGAVASASSPLIVRSVREIEVWILKLLSAPAPIPGKTCLHLSVQPKALSGPLIFALPDKSRLPLVDFPLHLPIQLMGVARTLRILVCLLLEQKVVLQSADYNKLSLCVLAFTALLYPLQYMFPVIPLLPPCMADAEQLLIAPTPYIIGVPTSFYSARKVFRMPKDVWLANLDTQELSYPEVLEEIPDLPEPECNNLIKQLNNALSTLPSITNNPSLDLALNQVNQLFKNPSSKTMTGYNPLIYISDEASTSVATRVSMVLFLLTKNILGGLSEYTRTLRLYPRPVVAFQFERFMRSRPRPCLFTSMLAKTQAVEYFAESILCARNEAFQRIEAGDYTPELIGDKAEWFSEYLRPVHFGVWPESVSGSLSDFSQSHSLSGSPLLYAVVAARLQYNNKLASMEDSDLTGGLHNYAKPDGVQDDLSDYPTDESASDTETEHSTASIGSTISDFASDCVDSGIGEPQNKAINSNGLRPDLIIERGYCSGANHWDGNSSTTDPLFVRSGEPLPSSLAGYFNPPLTPCLNESSERNSKDVVCTSTTDKDDASETSIDADKEVDKESTNSATSDTKTEQSKPFKPSTPSAGQTFRALTKLSANMFNTSARESDSDRLSQSVLSDGKINWNASVFVLLSELLRSNGNDQSADLARALNKRLSDESYLIHVVDGIKAGSTPSIFTRNRVISLLEYENYRNLLLARLNLANTSTSSGTGGSVSHSHMIDVPVSSWSQYKAMVWILRQVAQGLEVSLQSDVFIPTPANVHSEAFMTGRVRPQNTNDGSADGGLASAFALLEIAHTHYYQLPIRNERGFFTMGRASVVSMELGNSRTPLSRSASPGPPGAEDEMTKVRDDSSFSNKENTAKSPESDDPPVTPVTDFVHNLRIRTTSLTSSTNARSRPTSNAASPIGARKRITILRPLRSPNSRSPHLEKGESDNSSSLFKFPSDLDALRPLTPEPHSASRSPRLDSSNGTDQLTNKSSYSRGYRYRRSRLLTPDSNLGDGLNYSPGLQQRHSLGDLYYSYSSESSDAIKPLQNRIKVGRTFLFEDLIHGSQTRQKLWGNLQFWEDAFLDAVAQERDILGMDFRPTDLLSRYNGATPLKRKHAELEEDRLLAGLMHNLIAFMVMMGVERSDIRRKIRRLLAKSHLGLHYSQEISNLLDVLDLLYGNDIDLKIIQSRFTPQRSYEVYYGSDKNGDLLFIEVCPDYLLLRSLTGSIVDRWWYDQMINIIYRQNANILSVSIGVSPKPVVHSFYTTKCEALYHDIRKAMEQMSVESRRGALDYL